MSKLNFAVCAALVFCAGAAFSGDVKPAKPGQPLPDITAIDEHGAAHPLNLYKDKTGVVIFFFPKAFTGGCVCENAGFRDYLDKYQAKGYAVLGASRDIPETLVKFKEFYRLNYTLLSDPNDDLAMALGVTPGQRDTVVVGKDGKVIKIYTNVNAPKHHKELIQDLK